MTHDRLTDFAFGIIAIYVNPFRAGLWDLGIQVTGAIVAALTQSPPLVDIFDIFRLNAESKTIEHWDVMEDVPSDELLAKMY